MEIYEAHQVNEVRQVNEVHQLNEVFKAMKRIVSRKPKERQTDRNKGTKKGRK